ncbi:hypothetical protein DFJ77DRAFT_129209 [Powellomyces hirtus]|nr:hypothetical protein DFJ77DRAFT_129209 [Powellomyces hirtus]
MHVATEPFYPPPYQQRHLQAPYQQQSSPSPTTTAQNPSSYGSSNTNKASVDQHHNHHQLAQKYFSTSLDPDRVTGGGTYVSGPHGPVRVSKVVLGGSGGVNPFAGTVVQGGLVGYGSVGSGPSSVSTSASSSVGRGAERVLVAVDPLTAAASQRKNQAAAYVPPVGASYANSRFSAPPAPFYRIPPISSLAPARESTRDSITPYSSSDMSSSSSSSPWRVGGSGMVGAAASGGRAASAGLLSRHERSLPSPVDASNTAVYDKYPAHNRSRPSMIGVPDAVQSMSNSERAHHQDSDILRVNTDYTQQQHEQQLYRAQQSPYNSPRLQQQQLLPQQQPKQQTRSQAQQQQAQSRQSQYPTSVSVLSQSLPSAVYTQTQNLQVNVGSPKASSHSASNSPATVRKSVGKSFLPVPTSPTSPASRERQYNDKKRAVSVDRRSHQRLTADAARKSHIGDQASSEESRLYISRLTEPSKSQTSRPPVSTVDFSTYSPRMPKQPPQQQLPPQLQDQQHGSDNADKKDWQISMSQKTVADRARIPQPESGGGWKVSLTSSGIELHQTHEQQRPTFAAGAPQRNQNSLTNDAMAPGAGRPRAATMRDAAHDAPASPKSSRSGGGRPGSGKTSNVTTTSLRDLKLPLSPEATLLYYKELLTSFEQREILDFKEIYFAGAASVTKIGVSKRRTGADMAETCNVPGTGATTKDDGVAAVAYNHGYDDSRGDYYLTKHDHINYRYEILSLLGKGSFGQVVKCFDHKTKCHVALKIIRNKKRFERQGAVEVKVLERLKDEIARGGGDSSVQMVESFLFRGHLCITFELLGVNLYEWLKAGGFRGVHLGVIRRFTVQMLQCLELLARAGIVHCDLKPENVLLKDPAVIEPSPTDANGSSSSTTTSITATNTRPDFDPTLPRYEIKVIDFGSSCFENEKVYTYVQSRFYRSPEVILGISYNASIDMWSLGCILCELFTGYPLFPGENEAEQLLCIMETLGAPDMSLVDRGNRRKMFFEPNGTPRAVVNSKGRRRRVGTKCLELVLKGADRQFVEFVSRCLDWDPKKRITPSEALRHEWVLAGAPVPTSTTAAAAPVQSGSSGASSRRNQQGASDTGGAPQHLKQQRRVPVTAINNPNSLANLGPGGPQIGSTNWNAHFSKQPRPQLHQRAVPAEGHTQYQQQQQHQSLRSKAHSYSSTTASAAPQPTSSNRTSHHQSQLQQQQQQQQHASYHQGMYANSSTNYNYRASAAPQAQPTYQQQQHTNSNHQHQQQQQPPQMMYYSEYQQQQQQLPPIEPSGQLPPPQQQGRREYGQQHHYQQQQQQYDYQHPPAPVVASSSAAEKTRRGYEKKWKG